jgi:hypothetical protein
VYFHAARPERIAYSDPRIHEIGPCIRIQLSRLQRLYRFAVCGNVSFGKVQTVPPYILQKIFSH